jgi:hypothetical protein
MARLQPSRKAMIEKNFQTGSDSTRGQTCPP